MSEWLGDLHLCTWNLANLPSIRRILEAGGAFKLQVFSPYCFINKTGLDFALKTKATLGGSKMWLA